MSPVLCLLSYLAETGEFYFGGMHLSTNDNSTKEEIERNERYAHINSTQEMDNLNDILSTNRINSENYPHLQRFLPNKCKIYEKIKTNS